MMDKTMIHSREATVLKRPLNSAPDTRKRTVVRPLDRGFTQIGSEAL